MTSWLALKPLALVMGAGIALLAALLGIQTVRLTHAHEQVAALKQRAAEQSASWERQVAQSHAERVRITEEHRNEERRRVEAVAGIAAQAADRVRRARLDAAAAGVVADGLREQYAAALSGLRRCAGATGNPAATAGRSPAADLERVLAVVQRSIDDRAGALAAIADERGAAGAACERAYESLTRGAP